MLAKGDEAIPMNSHEICQSAARGQGVLGPEITNSSRHRCLFLHESCRRKRRHGVVGECLRSGGDSG